MQILKLLFLFTCIICSNQVFADCASVSESNYKKIAKRATNNALPGAGLYYQKGSCVIKVASGSSDLALNVKLQKTDRFVIGSITKMFVGVTSVKLAKAGVFNLDDKISQWLPSSITSRIPGSNKITIRNLLNHSSGIIDPFTDIPGLDHSIFFNQGRIFTELEFLEIVYGNALLFEPGTQYRYSNTNYILIGLIINQATGKHFTTNIRELILEPLAMNDTFHLSQPNNYLDYVHGYVEENGVLHDSHEMVKSLAFASGAMVSSLQDLATFIQAIFNNKTFMDNNQITTLLSTPVPNSTYGLGIITTQTASGVTYSHNGGEPGYFTTLQYKPGTDETVVTFVTGRGGVMAKFKSAFQFEFSREIIKSKWSYTLAP